MTLQCTSAKGRAFIEVEEGVRRYAYNDSSHNATFGVGHLLHLGPVTLKDKLIWGTPRLPRPMALVNRVFTRDLKKYEAAVRKGVGGKVLRPFEFDACVCLCINIGIDGFKTSSVARAIRRGRGSGHFMAAADAFLLWDNPPVLRGRRERERGLFLFGSYHPAR